MSELLEILTISTCFLPSWLSLTGFLISFLLRAVITSSKIDSRERGLDAGLLRDTDMTYDGCSCADHSLYSGSELQDVNLSCGVFSHSSYVFSRLEKLL